jgi:hypothetical protein
VVVAGPRLLRAPGNIRPVAVLLLFAGYAETSALLVTVLHGYPASAGVGLLAVAGVVAATAISWHLLGPRPSRTVSRAALLVAVAALVAGVDVTVPVHTLAGVPLPVPSVASIEAGVPVRVRLVNTDSTTHRYALAGTRFRVAAIDGSDVQGPTSLVDTAVLIPAGAPDVWMNPLTEVSRRWPGLSR